MKSLFLFLLSFVVGACSEDKSQENRTSSARSSYQSEDAAEVAEIENLRQAGLEFKPYGSDATGLNLADIDPNSQLNFKSVKIAYCYTVGYESPGMRLGDDNEGPVGGSSGPRGGTGPVGGSSGGIYGVKAGKYCSFVTATNNVCRKVNEIVQSNEVKNAHNQVISMNDTLAASLPPMGYVMSGGIWRKKIQPTSTYTVSSHTVDRITLEQPCEPVSLVSIKVGGPSSLRVGFSATVIATAVFSDGHNEDYSKKVSWTVGNSNIAFNSDAITIKGVAAGTSAIKATDSVSGKGGVFEFEVKPALERIGSVNDRVAIAGSGADRTVVVDDFNTDGSWYIKAVKVESGEKFKVAGSDKKRTGWPVRSKLNYDLIYLPACYGDSGFGEIYTFNVRTNALNLFGTNCDASFTEDEKGNTAYAAVDFAAGTHSTIYNGKEIDKGWGGDYWGFGSYIFYSKSNYAAPSSSTLLAVSFPNSVLNIIQSGPLHRIIDPVLNKNNLFYSFDGKLFKKGIDLVPPTQIPVEGNVYTMLGATSNYAYFVGTGQGMWRTNGVTSEKLVGSTTCSYYSDGFRVDDYLYTMTSCNTSGGNNHYLFRVRDGSTNVETLLKVPNGTNVSPNYFDHTPFTKTSTSLLYLLPTPDGNKTGLRSRNLLTGADKQIAEFDAIFYNMEISQVAGGYAVTMSGRSRNISNYYIPSDL